MSYSTHWRATSVAIAMLFAREIAAQSSAVSPPDTGVVGCYRLTPGPWSIASTLGPTRPTTVVRLDTIPRRPGQPGDLVAERIEPAEFVVPGDIRAQRERPAHWRRVREDSVIVLSWFTSTEAEAFYGRLVSGVLTGVVRRTSDAIPIDPKTRQISWDVWPWATASGVRVACP